MRRPPEHTLNDTLLPYTTLVRSAAAGGGATAADARAARHGHASGVPGLGPRRIHAGRKPAARAQAYRVHLARRLARARGRDLPRRSDRSEEHTSELQSLMRISYAVFCLKKKTTSN